MLKKFFGSNDEEKNLQPGEEELIGTRFFGEEDFDDVPTWIQQQIDKIDAKGLGDSPEDLTYELVGKTFIYRLVFDGPNGEILGIYRKLKDKSTPPKKVAAKKSLQWEVIGKTYGGMGDLSKVPAWVRKEMRKIPGGSSCAGQAFGFKGKRYIYRVEFWEHGGPTMIVGRKLRTTHFKKPKGDTSPPSWSEIGQAGKGAISSAGQSPYQGSIPKWVFGEIQKYPRHFDVFYHANGKRYKYGWVWAHHGQGTEFVIVWRKPRKWYWKKINS